MDKLWRSGNGEGTFCSSQGKIRVGKFRAGIGTVRRPDGLTWVSIKG